MADTATMENIHHWRGKVQEAQKRLQAAYAADLPEGTVVSYHQGANEVHVEILWSQGPYRAWVRNVSTGREYDLDYGKVDQIIRQPIMTIAEALADPQAFVDGMEEL